MARVDGPSQRECRHIKRRPLLGVSRLTDGAAKQLQVDFDELCIALEADASAELRWYLDLGSGSVILVTREYEPADYDGLTLGELLALPDRFVPVPGSSQATVDDMQAFVSQLSDARLKESLELALSAPRPERRFRAVLGWLPEELERWHGFRLARVEQRAREWLRTLGVVAA